MFIKNFIKDSIETKQKILDDNSILTEIEKISNVITNAYKSNKKVLLAGNGGSAADAQHIAAELVSKFSFDRKGLNAIALTINSSILTAISNDYGYENIFSKQIEAYGQEGDVFIGISTSGASKNIVNAVLEAKKNGLIIVGLTGNRRTEMDELCDYIIKVPSESTPNIQESHIMVGHIICALVENSIYCKN